MRGEWRRRPAGGARACWPRNRDAARRLSSRLVARLVTCRRCSRTGCGATPARGSRRNIRAHYDLGNELFALFLDETMTYSCAIFERPSDASLHGASVAKLDRICRKLDLDAEHRVLEIGTGWGGFALHAARHYGCHVTTTTISRAQHELATRAGRGGRADRSGHGAAAGLSRPARAATTSWCRSR